jgi:hypothetical protein
MKKCSVSIKKDVVFITEDVCSYRKKSNGKLSSLLTSSSDFGVVGRGEAWLNLWTL